MTTSTVQFTEERVKVAGTELYMLKGGSGTPVLVLHGVEGFEGWLAFHDALAEQATVYAPAHPGYGQTPCPEWVETIPHQAVFYHWFLQEQALAPVDVVGIGIGGWIAAQMAVMCPQHIRHLVLVDAAGVRPQHDEVFDIFITPWRQVIERCFYDAAHSPEYQRLFGGNSRNLVDPVKPDVPCRSACVFGHTCTTGRYPACWRKCVSPRLSCGVPRTRLFPLNVDSCTSVPSLGQPCSSSSSVATGHSSSARRNSHD